jgi:hypothetical protein
MKKILDKYQIYIEIICGLLPGLYMYFSESASENEVWYLEYIIKPIFYCVISWQFFGAITVFILRLIAYIFGNLKWRDFLKSYAGDRSEVFMGFAIMIGIPLGIILLALFLFIIFIPYLCIHLFIEFVINQHYILNNNFSNKERLLYGILEYLLFISFLDLIRYIGFNTKIKPLTLIATLVGLLLLISNLFYFPSGKVELMGEFDKVIMTLRGLFGIVFIIFPWLFDYTWKPQKFVSIFRIIKNKFSN